MRLPVWCLCALLAACAETPRDDYDDFTERTGAQDDATVDAAGDASTDAASLGRYQPLCGRWLLRALLAGGIDLGLRIEFSTMDGGPCPSEGPVTLKTLLWLERHEFTSPNILETTVDVDEHGRFVLRAIPLILDKEVLRGEVDVHAELIMDSHLVSDTEWCGEAIGSVTVPIVLDLAGSTFYARRDSDDATGGLPPNEGDLAKLDLPFVCPDLRPVDAGVDRDAAVRDATVSDAAGDAVAPDAGPVRPASPDLSAVPSVAADLTGHYVMNVRLSNGFPLKLWLSLVYSATDAGGWIDGTLRRFAPESVGLPPLATFGAAVDADGRFEVWLPDASIPTSLGQPAEGDLLFAMATLDTETFCGEAAGNLVSPLMVDLAGTTFFAERWVPGTMARADLPVACP